MQRLCWKRVHQIEIHIQETQHQDLKVPLILCFSNVLPWSSENQSLNCFCGQSKGTTVQQYHHYSLWYSCTLVRLFCLETLAFKCEFTLPLKHLQDCTIWDGISVISPCWHNNNTSCVQYNGNTSSLIIHGCLVKQVIIIVQCLLSFTLLTDWQDSSHVCIL